jgi:hypothetical protein
MEDGNLKELETRNRKENGFPRKLEIMGQKRELYCEIFFDRIRGRAVRTIRCLKNPF